MSYFFGYPICVLVSSILNWTHGFQFLQTQGMILLTVSAIVPTSTNTVVTPLQHTLPFLGLFLTALGLGGIWPCVPTFGADQFDDTDRAEKAQKEIYYNWYYFAVNGGFFIASTVLVWIQDNWGWGLGFGIPTLFSVIGIAGFLSSMKLYRYQKPGGSALARICQVLVAATRKINVDVPNDTSLLYEMPGKESAIVGSRKLMHTDGLRFARHSIQTIFFAYLLINLKIIDILSWTLISYSNGCGV